MQFKSTLKFHLTLVRGAVVKKTRSNVREAVKAKEPLLLAGGSDKSNQSQWKSVWRGIKKFQRELMQYNNITILEIYPKELKSVHNKAIKHRSLAQHCVQ